MAIGENPDITTLLEPDITTLLEPDITTLLEPDITIGGLQTMSMLISDVRFRPH